MAWEDEGDSEDPAPSDAATPPHDEEPEASSSRPEAELKVGEDVGRYVLLRPVAQGGMGVVYVAYDPELDRNVALKLLRPRKGRGRSQQWLVREAKALARLSHPNVVVVYDVGTWRDRVYVALEYVEGRTLDRWLRETARSWKTVVKVMLQAGRGLAAAHQADLIHLDFKPSNILIGEDDSVRVLDFGLARRRQETDSLTGGEPKAEPELTASMSGVQLRSQPGVVVGTPGYIAPELYLGEPTDARADQFAFCVTLWEALYRMRPFEGRRHRQIRAAVVRGEITPPPADANVPRWLHKILVRGLKTRPGDRYESMSELLSDLSYDPSMGRWRIGIAGGAALVITGGLVAQYVLSARAQALCLGGDERLAGAWDDARRSEIASAFTATGQPYADDAWTAVDSQLQAYSAAWVEAYTDACEDTRLRGEQSEELLDRRMQCLGERVQQLRALTDVFSRADSEVVERAVTAAASLPAIEECSDTSAMMARDEIATDPAIRARVDSLTEVMARARALEVAGRLREGLVLGQQGVDESRALGLAALEARSHLLVGSMLDALGDADGAQAAWERAIFTADRAGADEVRFGAYVRMVFLIGHDKNDGQRGRWFAELARAILERQGGDDESMARLTSNEAVLFSDAGEHQRAIAAYEEAIELHGEPDDEFDPERATTLNNFGSSLFVAGEYEEALEKYHEARDLRAAGLGAEHPDVAEVIGNIGNTLTALGRRDEGVAQLEHARGILVANYGESDPRLRTISNNLGTAYRSMGRFDESRVQYAKAAEAWRALDPLHSHYGAALFNLAEVDLELGQIEAARGGYERALAIFVQDAESPYTGHAFSGLGRARLADGDHRGAIEQFNRAIPLLEKAKGDREALGEARFALARALSTDAPQRSKALAHAEQAAADYESVGPRVAGKKAEVDAWIERNR